MLWKSVEKKKPADAMVAGEDGEGVEAECVFREIAMIGSGPECVRLPSYSITL